MKTKKKKLNVSKCIAIGDARRLNKKQSIIKSKRQLAIELFKFDDVASLNLRVKNVYFRIYRYERDGYYKISECLVERIKELLHVSERELVSDFNSCYKTNKECLYDCKGQCRESC